MTGTTVYFGNNNSLTLAEQLGNRGGEGSVFRTNKNIAVKIFNSKTNLNEKQKKIDLLIKSGIKDNAICLPIQNIYNGRNDFIGYSMKYAIGETMQKSIFIRVCLERLFPTWNRINLANLAITILDKIQILHDKEIIIGDINPQNIIVNNDNEIYFVDTDSYQINVYPCSVGMPLFTPPELQGADFKKTMRNKNHEYFSVATLLFKIFLGGKSPFAYRGGGDLGATIKAQNFSYPLGEEDNMQAPKGIWEFIWNELNYDMRRAFYDVFKQGRRLNLTQWKEVIFSFKEDLQRGYFPMEIFPTQLTSKQQKYKTLTFAGDIHDSNKRLRNDKTEITFNTKDPKIGVLELSTTAVKLLIGDQNKIRKQSFDFEHYSRAFSDKTNTGDLVDSDKLMDVESFNNFVIPAIRKRLDNAITNNVDILYSVATAAYRGSFNRIQVIDLIRNKCGINVKVLSKKEEALATLKAFLFSKPKEIIFDNNKNYMFIDQGGGSTEITVFKGQEIVETYSLNLGSTVIKNIFFKEATEKTTFDKAFRDSEKLIKDRLRVYLRNYNPPNLANFCISVGSAIIQATGGKGAYTKHGVSLTVTDIKNKISEFDNNIRTNYNSISHLYDAIEENKNEQLKRERKSDQIDNYLISRLALPMYLEIMERFKIEKIIVSNTGLYYGIFLDKLFQN